MRSGASLGDGYSLRLRTRRAEEVACGGSPGRLVPCEACDTGCVGSSRLRSVRGVRTPTPLKRGDAGECPLSLVSPCIGSAEPGTSRPTELCEGTESSHTVFSCFYTATRSRSAHFAAPGSPLVSAAPASSCAAQSTSYSRHAGSKQRGDDSDGTSCTLLCKRTTLQSTLYVLRAQATTSPCHQARSRPAPPPAPPHPRWHAKHRLLLRSVLVPLLAAGPQGNLQTAPRRFPSHQLLAACSMGYLFGLKPES